MKAIALCLSFMIIVVISSCNQGPACPAYNSVHTDKNYAYNPNNAERAKNDNKGDIEARKKAELSPKRSKKGKTSLFPKGVFK